jgi:hypothetical protein
MLCVLARRERYVLSRSPDGVQLTGNLYDVAIVAMFRYSRPGAP